MAQEKMSDGTDAPLEFLPQAHNRDCDEEYPGAHSKWGIPATGFPYIWYGNHDEDEYKKDLAPACDPWFHHTGKIDLLQVNTSIAGANGESTLLVTTALQVDGIINSDVQVSAPIGSFTQKTFNIQHPTKENKRLVYASLEGPENGVYIRGRLTGNNVIELPDYWRGLVDPESITVSLTQIGSSQDLMVDKIEWGSKVVVRSGNASNIDCYYIVNATRKDIEPLQVEQDVVEGKVYPEG